MTKEEIKAGMVVKLQNDHTGIIMPVIDTNTNEIVLCVTDGYRQISLELYNDELKFQDESPESDMLNIVAVYGYCTGNMSALDHSNLKDRPLLWSSHPVHETTLSQLESLLGYAVKLIDDRNPQDNKFKIGDKVIATATVDTVRNIPFAFNSDTFPTAEVVSVVNKYDMYVKFDNSDNDPILTASYFFDFAPETDNTEVPSESEPMADTEIEEVSESEMESSEPIPDEIVYNCVDEQ